MGGFFIGGRNVNYEIYQEDCLSGMRRLADGSVDAIICDPPFQTTDCDWDVRLPLEEMWTEFNRVTKHDGAIVLFSQLPFAVDLINANRKMFRYEYVWEKSKACGFLNANKMPLRAHENILVFYRRLPTYNPQYRSGKAYVRGHEDRAASVYRAAKGKITVNDGAHYYPRDVLHVNSVVGNSKTEPRYHPTQKPVALMEFLVKTYTNKFDTVLDATMGSGSTGVACMNTGRRFIGFELERKFFEAAKSRLDEAIAQRRLDLL